LYKTDVIVRFVTEVRSKEKRVLSMS
jgi:hypothetical protein